jgi:P27 family predicted phage terminase small subunit
MGRRGPKPAPSALRVLRGDRPDRINRREPQPITTGIEPPEWLAGDALDKWRDLVPRLMALGILGNTDIDALVRYCVTWVEWRRHQDICARGGDIMVMKDENGRVRYAQVAVSFTIMTKTDKILQSIAQEFGGTPSSRSTIVGSAVKPEADPLNAFLKKYGTA